MQTLSTRPAPGQFAAIVSRADGSFDCYAPGETLPGNLFGATADGPNIPHEVTMRQARLALLGAGLLAGVTAAIEALPEPQRTAAKIEWEYSTTVQRHRGLVQQLGAVLGMLPEQLDALFIAAGNIP